MPFYGSKCPFLFFQTLPYNSRLFPDHSVPRSSWYSLNWLWKAEGWVDLEATQWFWTLDPWIGKPLGHCSIAQRCLANDFVKLCWIAITDCISTFATTKKKITCLNKQTNIQKTNAWGKEINKLLDNSSFTVVNSKHNIAFWNQPIGCLAQHY